MKRILLVLAIVVAIPFLTLPAHSVDSGESMARGAAAETHETVHEDESHAPRTYFGISENILKFLNMVLFFGVLGYLLAGPIKRAFGERRGQIRSQLAEAKVRREKASSFAADMDERLKKLETEVAQILERAQEEGDRQKRELIAAGEAEAQKILNTARNEVDARVKAARKELTDYAGQLAADRATSILEQSLTDADRRRLFAESVESIGQVRS